MRSPSSCCRVMPPVPSPGQPCSRGGGGVGVGLGAPNPTLRPTLRPTLHLLQQPRPRTLARPPSPTAPRLAWTAGVQAVLPAPPPASIGVAPPPARHCPAPPSQRTCSTSVIASVRMASASAASSRGMRSCDEKGGQAMQKQDACVRACMHVCVRACACVGGPQPDPCHIRHLAIQDRSPRSPPRSPTSKSSKYLRPTRCCSVRFGSFATSARVRQPWERCGGCNVYA